MKGINKNTAYALKIRPLHPTTPHTVSTYFLTQSVSFYVLAHVLSDVEPVQRAGLAMGLLRREARDNSH